jgi:outer membrane protein OmpA-like peptidoglycan-associated protein/uncharacterized protein YidB (DUF937 family)
MFDHIINEAATRFGLSTSSVAALVRSLLLLISNERLGGAEGFVDLFHRAGLGDLVMSWFGGREARPITASQIESALGTNTLDRLAGASGLTRATVTSVLTFLLPKVVGALTPDGVLPSRNALLSQISNYTDRSTVKTSDRPQEKHVYDLTSQPRRWPLWVPFAAAALLALGAFLWLRGPAGTIEPQLTLINRDGRITYSGRVHDARTERAVVNALRSTFGAANVEGDLKIDRNVKRATWLSRLDDLSAAMRTPGVELSLDGNAASLGGWLSVVDRQRINDRLRGIFGPEVTVRARGDAAAEAARAANERARSILGAIGTSGVSSDTVVQAMNLAIINFASGSTEIPTENIEIIRRAAEAITRTPTAVTIEIGGHTDNTGDRARNLALSQARAEAVKNVLVSAGVPAATLTTRGYGDTQPKATNDTEYGRFQNRRIEYRIVQ